MQTQTGNESAFGQGRTPLTFTKVFTDSGGKTRFGQMPFSLTCLANASERGWLESSPAPDAPTIQVLRTSADYFSSFHAVSSRRYIVMLSGRREYEVADGKNFVAGPGSVVLVEDLSGTGHQTRGLGEEAVNVLIPVSDSK